MIFLKKKFRNSYSCFLPWATCKIYSENKVNFIPWISCFFIFLHKRERNFLDCLISRKEINISRKHHPWLLQNNKRTIKEIYFNFFFNIKFTIYSIIILKKNQFPQETYWQFFKDTSILKSVKIKSNTHQ